VYVYIQQQTWRNIAGKLNLHLHCWESLRPQIRYLLSTHTHTHSNFTEWWLWHISVIRMFQ